MKLLSSMLYTAKEVPVAQSLVALIRIESDSRSLASLGLLASEKLREPKVKC